MENMKSKEMQTLELANKIKAAFEKDGQDSGAASDEISKALVEFAEQKTEEMRDALEAYRASNDTAILASRNIRQQTDAEKKFWKAYGTALETKNVEKAFNGISNAYPESFIIDVTSDIRTQFPLLDAIDFRAGTLITKVITNAKSISYATWAPLLSSLSQQMEGAIKVETIENDKLYCLVPVAMDLIQAGPEWIETYVRALMTEAIGCAMQLAIVEGDGDGKPIGMNRDISENAVRVGDAYSVKTPIVVNDLSVNTLDTLYAELCEDEGGRERDVTGAILVCGVKDYYRKVKPALTIINALGVQVMPEELTVYRVPGMTSDRAVIGLPKKYKAVASFGGKTGAVEISDEAKFNEDLRMHKAKLLAGGRADDNNAFLWLDISNIQPAALPVNVVGDSETYPMTYKVRLTVAPKTATVAITDSNNESVGTCKVASATGIVDIPGLADGTYTLTVSKSGYTTHTETFTVNGGALDLGTVTITTA